MKHAAQAIGIIVLWVGIPTATAQTTLGPLAQSSTVVTEGGYDQFRTTMETGLRELGSERFIRVLWENGLSASTIPAGTQTVTVTQQRYDRILNPRQKTSLVRMMGDATMRRTLGRTPPRLPDYPLMVSVFVATATDTYKANRANTIRTRIQALNEPIQTE